MMETVKIWRRIPLLGVLLLYTMLRSPETLSAATVSASPACPHYAPGVSTGNVETTLLNEISGIALSRKNANVLWAHNDSGDSARVFALTTQGKHLGIYNLAGVTAVDWEDMAIGPGPVEGQDYLYLGDTGDNARIRSSVAVYRVPEPTVSADQEPASVELSDWAMLPMQYPGPGVYDSETLLVDPVSGDLFLATRDRAGEGVARVFRNPAPHIAGVVVTLELVATISLSMEIKGGDVSPSGDAVLLRPHAFGVPANGLYWARSPGSDLWEAFSQAPCSTPLVNETQGEALAFAADEMDYFTTSEGSTPPIYYYQSQPYISILPLVFR